MKKIIIAGAFMVALGFSANAGNPKTETKSDAKSTEAVANPSETKTADATAWFSYIGPQPGTTMQLNDPSNYGTSQVDPDDLCPEPGTNRCAAEFNVDGSGHRTGSPSGDVATKPGN